jgi:hypothetical protein
MTTSIRNPLIPSFQRVLLWAALSFGYLLPGAVYGQGWERYFGGNKEDQGRAVVQTADRGYLVVGFSESFRIGDDQDIDIFVVKTDVDGSMIWQKTFDDGFTEYGNAVIQAADGSYLIAGDISFLGAQGPFHGYLLKITERGQKVWHRTFADSSATNLRINDIVASPDGGYLLVGKALIGGANPHEDLLLIKVDEEGQEEWRRIFGNERSEDARAAIAYQGGYVIAGAEDSFLPPPMAFGNDMAVYRLDAQGQVIWKQVVATTQDEAANDLVATQDGNFVVAGYSGNNMDAALWKFDAEGNLLWEAIEDFFGGGDIANAIIELEDGNLVIAGLTEVTGLNTDFLIGKFSAEGELIWLNHTGDVINADEAHGIAPTFDGGYVITGSAGLFLTFINNLVLTLTDGNGDIYTNYVRGRVFYDLNANCMLNSGEPSLANWLVRASSPEHTFFGYTDPNGNYLIRVDTGDYVIEAIRPNALWESCSPNGVNLILDGFYDTTTVNFPIRALGAPCAAMEVDVSGPFTAPCTAIPYTVHYRNNGTADATGLVLVEVELDEKLSFEGASLPFTFDGQKYRFEVGAVPSNGLGSFTINTAMSCESIAPLSTVKVTATISPDALECLPLDPDWNGASVAVNGLCDDDATVEFRLENNTLVAMGIDRTFFVVEDDLMLLVQPFNLGPGQDTAITFPANGSTYRIIAEQVEGHPGMNYLTKAVEGCGTNDDGTYSTGYVAQWPEADGDASISIQVDETVFEQDAVRLIAHPRGLQDSIIAANTALAYRYVFNNLGNDPVTRVVIRDTLSPYLDPAAIVPGASSHPYRLEVYHTGVVKITFNNINLPENPSGDDPAAYGFVELKIGQQPDNPPGTVIEKQASVIFDYLPPVMTNKVRHVVEVEDLGSLVTIVPTNTPEPGPQPQLSLKAYPNPFVETLTLEVEGWDSAKPLDFAVFNAQGQLIRYERINQQAYTFHRRQLPAGSYFYVLKFEGKPIGSGTLIVR